jgi:hypothetical protein
MKMLPMQKIMKKHLKQYFDKREPIVEKATGKVVYSVKKVR